MIQTTPSVICQIMSNLKHENQISSKGAFKYLSGIRKLCSCYSKSEKRVDTLRMDRRLFGRRIQMNSVLSKMAMWYIYPNSVSANIPFLPTPAYRGVTVGEIDCSPAKSQSADIESFVSLFSPGPLPRTADPKKALSGSQSSSQLATVDGNARRSCPDPVASRPCCAPSKSYEYSKCLSSKILRHGAVESWPVCYSAGFPFPGDCAIWNNEAYAIAAVSWGCAYLVFNLPFSTHVGCPDSHYSRIGIKPTYTVPDILHRYHTLSITPG